MPFTVLRRETLAWFALRTRARHEKLVARALAERGVECFLPLSRERHRWSDRFTIVEVPLFSTYLFVRLDPGERAPVHVRGAVALVALGDRPTPVDDDAVEALLRLAAAGVPL